MNSSSTDTNPSSSLQRALLSLDGLSVGDALGQLLSTCSRSARRVMDQDGLPGGYWWHTDDTQMAMAITEELAALGRISPDSLARRFVQRYQADPGRGYGKGARMQLERMAEGQPWELTSAAAFSGRGSKGNGSAMRVAPLGAYFAYDLDSLLTDSRLSSVVTHSHPEGVAGSIAVAVAAATVWQRRSHDIEELRAHVWQSVLQHTPEGETREGILKASMIPLVMGAENAARLLGSGFLVTAPDTVPFALWCAARHLDNFQEAMIATLEGDGDCDTNCAIVGGIVALYTGREGIPAGWLKAREPLNLEIFDHVA